MTTMGLRGVLACAFIVSTVMLTGMAALPSGAAASEPAMAGTVGSADPGPGLFDRFKRKACETSLAATGRDHGPGRDRRRQCGY